jgi:H+-transporting ATPase
LHFEPFDPTTKRSEASIRENDTTVRIVKGEPATLAELTRTPWKKIEADVIDLSAKGARVLAVASGTDLDLHFVGLVALSDPPREDSAALIANLKNRGIRVMLVTGDGEATARAIADQVGITGAVAPDGLIGKESNLEQIMRFNIFTRVFPQDKFALVQALQKGGYVVGMTGDGVNDAPALRQADVGIAVASATDVAKAAASLVLTRSGISEIVMAVDESRRIFQRMKSFVLTMISMKLSTPIFFALGVIFLSAFVLTPLQIVLLMLLGNFVTMSVSMDQVAPSPKPDRWDIRSLMTAGGGLAILSLVLNGVVFFVVTHILQLGVPQTQTLVFFWLVIGSGQALLYITRGRGFFWERPYPGRLHLMITLIEVGLVALAATFGWLMAPVSPWLIGGLLILVLVFLLVADILKVTLMRLSNPTQAKV